MSVAHYLAAMVRVRDRVLRRWVQLRTAIRERRFTDPTVVALLGVLAAFAATGIWCVHDILSDLPSIAAVRTIGSGAQATTLLDSHDRTAFTIFQEQRIDVPLSR